MNMTRRDILSGMAAMIGGVFMHAPVHAGASGGAPAARPGRLPLATFGAFDGQGRLWVTHVEPAVGGDGEALSNIVLAWSADGGQTWARSAPLLQTPEAVEANGEGRPKLAFGKQGELFVSFTSPLSRPHTGTIRFVRSLDAGQTFSAPLTVQRDRALTGHRFDSMMVDREGRIFIAWIDKRDADAARASGRAYRGAAVYYAVSRDNGASFQPDVRLADHCCECCRIALAMDPAGRVFAMWRHIFAPNVRDHAMALLSPHGKPGIIERVSADNWRIDACPHHGPSMAFDGTGRRHQVWFSGAQQGGGLFYSATVPGKRKYAPAPLGGMLAQHGEVMTSGAAVAIVWKEFDGERTQVRSRWSADNGASWQEDAVASSSGQSDHPHLASNGRGIWLVWRTEAEGVIARRIGEKA